MENNVGIVHTECVKERLDKFQQANPHLSLKDVEFVKIGFPIGDLENDEFTDETPREWMWVKVTSYDDETKKFNGFLNNDPIRVDYIHEGMSLEATYNEICQALTKDGKGID